MSLLPAHPSGNGQPADDDDERMYDERPSTGASADETIPPTVGQGPERPRYAFAYAPDDELTDDDNDDNDLAGDRLAGDRLAGDRLAGDDLAGDDLADDDLAAEYEDEDDGDRAGAVPVFTPAPATAEVPAVSVPTVAVPTVAESVAEVPEPMSAAGTAATPVPAPWATIEREPVMETPVTETPVMRTSPATAADLDEPLLADPAGLRARWQRAQADFVDDPRAAVTDAAALVEETAQAIIDALEQRQRQLRLHWEQGQANGSAAGQFADQGAGAAADPSGTEGLRLTMRSYRALFNQICAA
jgi:hypothetical protein